MSPNRSLTIAEPTPEPELEPQPEQLGTALKWPSPVEGTAGDDFAVVCSRAAAAGVAVSLQADVQLDEVVQVRRGKLVIVGGGMALPCISGTCHSLFQVQGRATLELRGVKLQHHAAPCPATPTDLRPVGAAVFVLNRASVTLERCAVTTTHGMGLWAVQRGLVVARQCSLGPIGRSGVALFGKATAMLLECRLSDCQIHGACARGESILELQCCQIDGCIRRGAYVYQRATLLLAHSTVVGTMDSTRAAVEAAGCRKGDAVTLQLQHTSVCHNRGCGLRLRGAVKVPLLCHVSVTHNGDGARCNDLKVTLSSGRHYLNVEVSTNLEGSAEELELNSEMHREQQLSSSTQLLQPQSKGVGEKQSPSLATTVAAEALPVSSCPWVVCPRLTSTASGICSCDCYRHSGSYASAIMSAATSHTDSSRTRTAWQLWLGRGSSSGDPQSSHSGTSACFPDTMEIGHGVAAAVAVEWRQAVLVS